LREQLCVLAALVLALFAGEHVLPALHHALVAHELCPEHGVLEHAGGSVRERAHHENGQVFAQSSPYGDVHEHCDSVPASPPRSPAVAAYDGVFVPAAGARASAVSAARAVIRADVVAFAPKQSPPA
jgi:hypothetical protein